MNNYNPFLLGANSRIETFYKVNPQINFEKTNLLFIELFEKASNKTAAASADVLSSDFQAQLIDFMSIYTYEIGENILENVLNKLKPTSEIIKNMNDQICCNFILKRNNKSTILIESKECETNIDTIVTNGFVETVKQQNNCGIFMSQHSGILNKYNYQIEIYNENIVVYIQDCKYDPEKIKNAIEIIDNLHDKLKQIKKNNIIELIQEYNINIIKQIENFNFNCLNKYLCSKIDTNKKVGIYTCNLCNIYTSNKLKGISAHKRGCKKKQVVDNTF